MIKSFDDYIAESFETLRFLKSKFISFDEYERFNKNRDNEPFTNSEIEQIRSLIKIKPYWWKDKIDMNLTDDTKKVLSDFGISEAEYEEMISFIGRMKYNQFKDELPFLMRWRLYGTNDDLNIGHEQLRKIINFYKRKKSISDRSRELEDFFLDLIESGNDDVIPSFDYNSKIILFSIEYNKKSLVDISNILLDIDRRFKRAGVNYKVNDIYKSIFKLTVSCQYE